MRRRFKRRERRELEESAATTVGAVRSEVEAAAVRTEAGLDGPTPEDVERWFAHSVGSWKRGFTARA